jgi:hypothetical protein
MQSVTSNAVAEAISFVNTEQEAGYYFDAKRYHKTFIFEDFYITANTPQILQANFEIPYNKIVNVNGFASNGSAFFKDLNIYVASNNNSLCIYPRLGDANYWILIDVYYVK